MDEKYKMIKFTLLVYYVQKFKTKKDKVILMSLNWYRNSHYTISNEVKHYYHNLIRDELKDCKASLLNEKYKVEYIYYYKNKNSDMANVCSLIDKFTQDSLQELNIVSNDNVRYCQEVVFKVGGMDKLNPRVEISIEALD